MTTQPTYSIDGLDLRKLFRRVSANSLSPQQAEQLLREADNVGVRLVRGLIGAVVGLAFLSVGVFLLRLAVTTYVEKQAFASHARYTTGKVVKLSRHAIRHKRPTYAPIVSYQVAGQTYQLEGLATSPAAYTVGQILTVQYDPDRPAVGQLASFVEQWLLGLLAGGVGCLLTIIGLFVVWSTAKMGLRPVRVPVQLMQQVLNQMATGQLTVEAAQHQLQPGQGSGRSYGWWVVFVLVVGAGLFFSLRQISQSIHLLISGQRTQGKVISFVHSGNGTGAAPLIRYQVAGQAYECVGAYDTSPQVQPGDLVDVLYDPAYPADAKPRTVGILISGPLFGLLIVLLLLAVPVYSWSLTRSKS
ncbi:hypothetical protein FAES_3089 [Fibrella aestuarina BUZ 2]|uniref:DUF3592 domain-containing protein n=1 Tax=Fibrella aestuarina BUZ 2 TaxID=1166018 RepID=I0KAE5_9BACT|nr:DUF3592 domain-containing protein [Fibrella aestuarina]CCH01098.1 hypothetical protein FAES_3089 [Fibrella aestuarina BUZ 2]